MLLQKSYEFLIAVIIATSLSFVFLPRRPRLNTNKGSRSFAREKGSKEKGVQKNGSGAGGKGEREDKGPHSADFRSDA